MLISVAEAKAARTPWATIHRNKNRDFARAQDVEQLKPEFWHGIPNSTGKDLAAVVVTYLPGGKSLPHHHAQSAFIYAHVLSGAIRSQLGTSPLRSIMPAKASMRYPGSHHSIRGSTSDKTQRACWLSSSSIPKPRT